MSVSGPFKGPQSLCDFCVYSFHHIYLLCVCVCVCVCVHMHIQAHTCEGEKTAHKVSFCPPPCLSQGLSCFCHCACIPQVTIEQTSGQFSHLCLQGHFRNAGIRYVLQCLTFYVVTGDLNSGRHRTCQASAPTHRATSWGLF